MKRTKTICFSLVLMLVAVALIVSCAPTPPPEEPTPPPAVEEPKYGGTLHLTIPFDPKRMDPGLTFSATANQMNYMYYDQLVRYEPSTEGFTVTPCVAESWETSPDGLVWTFHIRKGIKYHNIPPVNGRELVAQDVKYTWDRLVDPETRSPFRPTLLATGIERAECPDNYTVQLIGSKPIIALDIKLAIAPVFSIVPHEVIEQDGNADSTFIGTGPFILEEYNPDVGLKFRKNPDYWREGKPYVDRIEVTVMPDPAHRLAAFRAGELDVVDVGKVDRDAAERTNPDIAISNVPFFLSSDIVPNIQREPWDDVRVRQAIMYALDPDAIIQSFYDGEGEKAGFLAQYLQDWGALPLKDFPKHDVAKAKALLAEAGYPDGIKTTILQDTVNISRAYAGGIELIVAQLKEAGIDAEIIPLERAEFRARRKALDFDLIGQAGYFVYPDPHQNLYNEYHSTKGYTNWGKYHNARVDELLDLQANEPNVEKRQQYFTEIVGLLWEDMPRTRICYHWKFQLIQPWVKGWQSSMCGGTGGFEVVYDVWLAK